jgi:hypothetical protein
MNADRSVECELVGETEVLRDNLPQCHFVHHKYHVTWRGIEPLPPPQATNRLSYGTDIASILYEIRTERLPNTYLRALPVHNSTC